MIIVCAIKDRVMSSYAQPMFFQTTAQAIRAFADEINREASDNNLHKHADDFELYKLGDYDENVGYIENCEHGAYLLMRGRDAKQPK